MSSGVPSFSNLPTPVKAGVLLAGGGGVTGAALMLAQNTQYLVVVVVGIAVVALLLGLYKWYLRVRQKSKSTPFARLIARNAGSAPQAVTDPAKRARLDDLRKRFEEGVEKFRAAGKNIYGLPWYLLVGPSGSGKTEAMRHCNVGFPPGLQDHLQGAGGTLNMHWWFTSHAVVLDTAGKMLMEEVRAGETGEWKEFLALLRRARATCPINGLLLAIGTDSLIKDSAEKIEANAGQIARQLELIQRTLDVRFPVFVLITKCDLINGFREFFDRIDDPQLQHQILGWSNPAGLDEAFSPEKVESHIESVRQRLVRRRMGLLLDPVHTEDPQARRADQVDALYALPESLAKLSSRLRRYLELIFVAGEWSPKPLFLRGIYFTSSMREGSELDADLAEALGVSVDSLPGGKAWEKEKSFFLRDVFMAKVFKEKGLVTRASNVGKAQRRRRLTVMSAALVTVAVLLGLTVVGKWDFSQRIGDQQAFWGSVAEKVRGDGEALALIASEGAGGACYYLGGDELEVDGLPVQKGEFGAATRGRAQTRISVPVVFQAFSRVGGDGGDLLRSERRSAHAAVLEATTLVPLIEAVRAKILEESAWEIAGADGRGAPAPAALAELLRLETYALKAAPVPEPGETGRRGAGARSPAVEIDPLFGLVLGAEDYANATGYKGDRGDLQVSVDWAYADAGKLLSGWPPPSFRAAADDARGTVFEGVGMFAQTWVKRAQGSEGMLGRLKELRDALVEFRAQETALAALPGVGDPGSAPKTSDEYDGFAQKATDMVAGLKAGGERVGKAIGEIGAVLGGGAPGDLSKTFVAARDEVMKRAGAEFDLLVAQLPALPSEGAPPAALREPEELAKVRAELKTQREGLEKTVGEVAGALEKDFASPGVAALLAGTREGSRAYQARLAMLERAGAELVPPGTMETSPGEGAIAAGLKAIDEGMTTAHGEVDRLVKAAVEAEQGKAPPTESAAGVGETAKAILRVARAKKATLAIAGMLRTAPGTGDEVGALVATGASRPGVKPAERPTVPMSSLAGGRFEDKFHPEAATRVLSDWSASAALVRGGGPGGPGVLDAEELQRKHAEASRAFADYATQYATYWTLGVQSEARVRRYASWGEFQKDLGRVKPDDANDSLATLWDAALVALAAAPSETLAQGELAAGKARLESEVKSLRKGTFGPACDTTVMNWESLPDAENEARLKIIQLAGAGQFRLEYLKAFDEPGVGYWNSMVLEGLRVLADAFEADAARALAMLRQMKKFPLATDADRGAALRADEVRSARIAVERAQSRLGGEGPAAVPETVTPYDAVNQQIARLSGGRLMTRAQRDWAARAGAFLAAIGGDEPAAWSIGAAGEDPGPPRGEPNLAGSAVEPFLYFEVWAAEKKMGDRRATGDYDAPAAQAMVAAVPGGAVTLRFFKDQYTAEAGGVAEFAGPWNVLAAALSPESAQRPGVGADAKAWWLAPVIVTASGTGQRYYFWARLTPSVALPRKDAWPSAKAWLD